MNRVFVFIVTGLIALSSLSLEKENLIHADFGPDLCPDESDAFGPYSAEDLAKMQYENRVDGFNTNAELRAGSIEDLNEIYMKPDGVVDELGKMAGCLFEIYKTDPDSVAKFGNKAQAILSYDMEKLVRIAPELADYATVPEFGSLVIMIMAVSLIACLVIVQKYHNRLKL